MFAFAKCSEKIANTNVEVISKLRTSGRGKLIITANNTEIEWNNHSFKNTGRISCKSKLDEIIVKTYQANG